MANRALLHKSKLDEFKQWLIDTRWNVEPPKGDYAVLRARKPGRKFPLIVYDRICGEHLSVSDRDEKIIRLFILSGRD